MERNGHEVCGVCDEQIAYGSVMIDGVDPLTADDVYFHEACYEVAVEMMKGAR